MKFFLLNDKIFATHVRNSVVLLDTLNDKYILLTKEQTEKLENYIKKQIPSDFIKRLESEGLLGPLCTIKKSYLRYSPSRKKIAPDKIIEETFLGIKNFRSEIEQKPTSKAQTCFLMYLGFFVTIFAIFGLCIVHVLIKLNCLSILLFCKNNTASCKNLALSKTKRKSRNLAKFILGCVEKGACFLPFSVHCLEKSIVTKWLGKLFFLDLRVCIGVQNEPHFWAHAWVEFRNKAVEVTEWSKYFYVILTS